MSVKVAVRLIGQYVPAQHRQKRSVIW
jgi:hypothetical protein